MATTEGLKPIDTNSQVPVDPNVSIPEHVRRAAEEADKIHKQAYTPPAADPPAQVQQQAEPQAQPQQQVQQPVAQQDPAQQVVQQAQQAEADNFTGNADTAALRESEWARRYNSMHGRWQQSERSRAAMEQQMGELAVELQRTQAMLQTQQQTPAPQQQVHQPVHNNLITAADREAYGDELIDLAARVAQSAVAPELESLRARNEELTKQVRDTAKRGLFQKLDQSVPQWRQINQDTRFKAWLRLPNIYTGEVRAEMLKRAVDGADAPKVMAFFRDFLTEAQATGQMAPAQQQEQQATQQQAPRTAAVALETLAAPGRQGPHPGDGQVPADKPIYSRADIAKFFDEKRRGLWANRIKEAQDYENDLSLAQREGRIRG